MSSELQVNQGNLANPGRSGVVGPVLISVLDPINYRDLPALEDVLVFPVTNPDPLQAQELKGPIPDTFQLSAEDPNLTDDLGVYDLLEPDLFSQRITIDKSGRYVIYVYIFGKVKPLVVFHGVTTRAFDYYLNISGSVNGRVTIPKTIGPESFFSTTYVYLAVLPLPLNLVAGDEVWVSYFREAENDVTVNTSSRFSINYLGPPPAEASPTNSLLQANTMPWRWIVGWSASKANFRK